jgi:hypothetical protein
MIARHKQRPPVKAAFEAMTGAMSYVSILNSLAAVRPRMSAFSLSLSDVEAKI